MLAIIQQLCSMKQKHTKTHHECLTIYITVTQDLGWKPHYTLNHRKQQFKFLSNSKLYININWSWHASNCQDLLLMTGRPFACSGSTTASVYWSISRETYAWLQCTAGMHERVQTTQRHLAPSIQNRTHMVTMENFHTNITEHIHNHHQCLSKYPAPAFLV